MRPNQKKRHGHFRVLRPRTGHTCFSHILGTKARRTLRRLGMKLSSRWRTASLVAGALFIGSVIGTPLAQAVSAGLVRIEGGHNANLAAVSKTGQLSVNAGLATTAAGQVKTTLAS